MFKQIVFELNSSNYKWYLNEYELIYLRDYSNSTRATQVSKCFKYFLIIQFTVNMPEIRLSLRIQSKKSKICFKSIMERGDRE